MRFFVLMGVAAFIVYGATAFFAHRAVHGRTSEERSAYLAGEKAGEEAVASKTLPTAASLNTLAQHYFEKQGIGEPMVWKLAFEHGYEDGFKKTHHAP